MIQIAASPAAMVAMTDCVIHAMMAAIAAA